MAQITFTIDDTFIERVKTAMAGLYPIPADVDEEGNETPQYTESQWAKERTRRFIKDTVLRYEDKAAKDAINITVNDGDIT